VQSLLFDTLLEQSKDGLVSLGISSDSISYYIDDIIRNRVKSGWTGAAWQKSFIDTHGADFQEMTKAYIENQVSMEPVYKWKV
jgi:small-conductance mechanosensitive channel